MIVISTLLWFVVTLCAWRAGYWCGRSEDIQAQHVAFTVGHVRCELQHGAAVQRGYVLAHGDLCRVLKTIPDPRWWEAFKRRPVTPTLPDEPHPARPLLVSAKLS